MPDQSVAIVIPALNEAQTIISVIEGVRDFGQVMVVDDGSSDETVAVSEAAGAQVVSHEINQGYDAALCSGLLKALDLKADIVISIDADGQHRPDDIKKFIEAMWDDKTDIAIGLRPKPARISEALFRIYARWRYGIGDILCGLKAYRTEHVKKYADCLNIKSIGTALALRIVSKGGVLKNIPIQIEEREDAPRLGRAFKANMLIFVAMIKVLRI